MSNKTCVVTKIELALIVPIFLLLIGCGGGNGNNTSSVQISNATVSGNVQKGPFIAGTSVTLYELDNNLNQTGKTFNTQTNAYGSFQIPNISLVSPYVEVKADGYYFNEVTGTISASLITLYALVDLRDRAQININILTHLEKDRIRFLVGNGLSFSEAKQKAQKEILQIFGITKDTVAASETLDLSKGGDDNSILLMISSLFQGNRTESELSELLANISSDIRSDGVLTNTSNGSALINSTRILNMANITNNLQTRYASLGLAAVVPDCTAYLNDFMSTASYPITESITYPNSGPSGINVLSQNATVFTKFTPVSMAAVVPRGYSLKIKVTGNSDNWAYAPVESTGWQWSDYDQATYSRVFTSNTTGTINVRLQFHGTTSSAVTFDVYENGSVTPSWQKTITVQ